MLDVKVYSKREPSNQKRKKIKVSGKARDMRQESWEEEDVISNGPPLVIPIDG